MSNLKYVGMDVHKATCVIIVLNALGQFEKQVIIHDRNLSLNVWPGTSPQCLIIDTLSSSII